MNNVPAFDHRAVVAYVKNLIKSGEFEVLGTILDPISQWLDEHRRANGGWTPSPLFVPGLRFGGVCVVTDIVVSVYDESSSFIGFALKKREKEETGWHGQFHVVGTPSNRIDTDESIFRRLSNELYGTAEKWRWLLSFAVLAGREIHDEKIRGVVCYAETYEFGVPLSTFAKLQGEWRIFTEKDFGDESIIDHHHAVLRWMADPKRPPRVDLRSDPRYR